MILNLLSLKRRVTQLRNNNSFLKKLTIPLLVVFVCFINSQTVFATTTVDIPEILQVTGIVYMKTVNPAPPPTPLPPNNGIPIAPILSGTDSAVFRGIAYPGSTVSVLKNGLVVEELPTSANGAFELSVRNIIPGTYTFTLAAKDGLGIKSSQVTYTIMIVSGIITEINGIIMPPTITTDKTEVKPGSDIIFSGKSIPNSDVLLTIFARSGITRTITSNASGTWSYVMPITGFESGSYNAKARTKTGTEFTLYSDTVLFTIGTKNTFRKKGGSSLINARCDLNNDSRVNLLDFSIMAFWYKRLGFPMKVDLNSDNRINLTDLSILAYCWTG